MALKDKINIYQNPGDFLERVYPARGIDKDDLEGKYRLMRTLVVCSDENLGEPTLAKLELQFLKDKGFSF